MKNMITPVGLEKNVRIKIGIEIIFSSFISLYSRMTKTIFIKYSIASSSKKELKECINPFSFWCINKYGPIEIIRARRRFLKIIETIIRMEYFFITLVIFFFFFYCTDCLLLITCSKSIYKWQQSFFSTNIWKIIPIISIKKGRPFSGQPF